MAPDVLVSRELKSLQDELATAKMERSANTERAPAASPAIAPTSLPELSPKPPEQMELQGYLRQLADEINQLFGDAEKSVSAHPTRAWPAHCSSAS